MPSLQDTPRKKGSSRHQRQLWPLAKEFTWTFPNSSPINGSKDSSKLSHLYRQSDTHKQDTNIKPWLSPSNTHRWLPPQAPVQGPGIDTEMCSLLIWTCHPSFLRAGMPQQLPRVSCAALLPILLQRQEPTVRQYERLREQETQRNQGPNKAD